MIVATIAQKRNEVKELINSLDLDGITFNVVNEVGIKLHVETNSDDEQAAAKLMKKEIKSFLGPALFFGVDVQ